MAKTKQMPARPTMKIINAMVAAWRGQPEDSLVYPDWAASPEHACREMYKAALSAFNSTPKR